MKRKDRELQLRCELLQMSVEEILLQLGSKILNDIEEAVVGLDTDGQISYVRKQSDVIFETLEIYVKESIKTQVQVLKEMNETSMFSGLETGIQAQLDSEFPPNQIEQKDEKTEEGNGNVH